MRGVMNDNAGICTLPENRWNYRHHRLNRRRRFQLPRYHLSLHVETLVKGTAFESPSSTSIQVVVVAVVAAVVVFARGVFSHDVCQQ